MAQSTDLPDAHSYPCSHCGARGNMALMVHSGTRVFCDVRCDELFYEEMPRRILNWCDSIDLQFDPRELDNIPRGESPRLIEEQFLATAIRYLRAMCEKG